MNAPVRPTVTVRARERGGIVVEIPGVELVSEANARGHTLAKARRVAQQRAVVESTLRTMGGSPPALPAVVCITRIAPRELDSDNLASACKAVRDAVAVWLVPVEQVVRTGTLRGTRRTVGDDRDARVEWRCAQERGPYGVRIEVAPRRAWDPRRPSAAVEARGVETHVDLVLAPATLDAVVRQLAEIARGEREACVLQLGFVRVSVRRTEGA